MYIPLQTLGECFALGIFDKKEDAENAYIEYIKNHDNFKTWFKKLKEDFNNKFNKYYTINCLDDFKNVIFKEEWLYVLDGETHGKMNNFWEERLICFEDIWEIDDKYPDLHTDITELCSHYDFSCDKEFGNHCNFLIFSILHKSESKYNNFENFISRMAKLHPIF